MNVCGLVQCLSRSCSQGVEWDHSHLKFHLEQNVLPKCLMRLLAGFSFSWAVGPQASIYGSILSSGLCTYSSTSLPGCFHPTPETSIFTQTYVFITGLAFPLTPRKQTFSWILCISLTSSCDEWDQVFRFEASCSLLALPSNHMPTRLPVL